jgi:hypothetical protein
MSSKLEQAISSNVLPEFMCRIDDAERSVFFVAKKRKAKKEHVCDECQRKIVAGELYTHTASGYDGTVFVNKRCCHCDVALNGFPNIAMAIVGKE